MRFPPVEQFQLTSGLPVGRLVIYLAFILYLLAFGKDGGSDVFSAGVAPEVHPQDGLGW